MIEYLLVQGNVGLDAFDDHLRQCIAHACDGRIPRVAVGDDLADHGVVERRHVVAGVDVAVDPNAGTAGRMPETDGPGRRHEGLGVLGVDAAFHRMAANLDVVLAVRQWLARGDEQLRFDDVDAGHELGHGMLDLNARVHFDEIEFVVLVQELERARVAITDFPARSGAAFAHGLALLRRQSRCGSFFDDFLVAALHGTVALPQVHHVAVIVGEHLKLDMARLLEELLHVNLRVTERGERLRLGDADGVQQRCVGMHHAHAAAAAAAGGLDDDRIADVLGDAEIFVDIIAERPIRAGHAGDARGLHDLDGGHLVAHQANGFGAGTHEDEAALLDAFGEVRVLRQKAVARMNRHRIGDLGGADDGGHVQIGQGGLRRPDADGLVREQHVFRIEVGGRVYGHGLDAEFAAGAQDTESDLASISDDDFFDHRGYSMMNSGWPNSTGSPFLARIAVTRPALSDSI